MAYAPSGVSLATKGVLHNNNPSFIGGGGGPPMTYQQQSTRPYVLVKQFDTVDKNNLSELSQKITIKLISDI